QRNSSRPPSGPERYRRFDGRRRRQHRMAKRRRAADRLTGRVTYPQPQKSRDFQMKSITKIAATALLSASVALPALAQDKTVLTVIVYGGSFEDGWTKSVIDPFEAANPDIDVQIATGLTMQTVAMMRAQKDNVAIDVVMMDEV